MVVNRRTSSTASTPGYRSGSKPARNPLISSIASNNTSPFTAPPTSTEGFRKVAAVIVGYERMFDRMTPHLPCQGRAESRSADRLAAHGGTGGSVGTRAGRLRRARDARRQRGRGRPAVAGPAGGAPGRQRAARRSSDQRPGVG